MGGWRLAIRTLLGALAWLAAAAGALPPPQLSHFFRELHVTPRGTLLAAHTDGVSVFDPVRGEWHNVLPEVASQFLDLGADDLLAVTWRAIYRSRDEGATWQATQPGSDGAPTERIAGDGAGRLHRCVAGPRWEASPDAGRTWTAWPVQPALKACAAPSAGAGMIVVGPLITRDGAASWQALFKQDEDGRRYLDERTTVRDVMLATDATLQANTWRWSGRPGADINEMPAAAVYRSVDGGRSWSLLAADGEVLALDGARAWLRCGPDQRLCLAQGERVTVLPVTGTAPASAVQFVSAPGGILYRLDPHGVARWSAGAADWEPLPVCGVRIGWQGWFGTPGFRPYHEDCAHPR